MSVCRSCERELDRDAHLDLYRVAVKQSRLELPLVHGIDGGLIEFRQILGWLALEPESKGSARFRVDTVLLRLLRRIGSLPPREILEATAVSDGPPSFLRNGIVDPRCPLVCPRRHPGLRRSAFQPTVVTSCSVLCR